MYRVSLHAQMEKQLKQNKSSEIDLQIQKINLLYDKSDMVN